MLRMFKKRTDNNIYAPTKGKCLDISECADLAFSGKAMGDGFMVATREDVVCSPCDGNLSMIFPTKHAFGITKDDGEEILVHIGIDTVELNGKHFEKLHAENTRVRKGIPIIRYDNKAIREMGYNTDILVVVTGNPCIAKKHLHEEVKPGDVIIERPI